MPRAHVSPMSADPASRLATVRGADSQSIRCLPQDRHSTEVQLIIFCEWPGFHWARDNVKMVLRMRNSRRLDHTGLYSVTPVDADDLEKGWVTSAIFREPFLVSDIDDIQLFVQRSDGSAAIAYLFAA